MPLRAASLRRGKHRLFSVPMSSWVGHAAPEWQSDELRAGAPSGPHNSHVDTLRVRMVMRVVAHAVGPADVDLVLLALAGGLAVHGVVEVHALGGVAPPVAPDQVDAGADQAEHHCGNDRNCMRLTHSGSDTGKGAALTRQNESTAGNERHREEESGHAGDRGGQGGSDRELVCVGGSDKHQFRGKLPQPVN